MITGVIPYFQRECPLRLHVIIVDDASPVPAAAEVSAVKISCTTQVVRRINGGPGAARHTGLDRVPAGTRFVAFLDSDGRMVARPPVGWQRMLQSGSDFYFADLTCINSDRALAPSRARVASVLQNTPSQVSSISKMALGDST